MISLSALTVMVSLALVLATATPLILLGLLVNDLKQGKLW